jgi:hypothetical protein
MSIRSQLEGKEFSELGPFIDALSIGVNEEIQTAVQPLTNQINQLSGTVSQLEQQVVELGGTVSELGATVSGLSSTINEIGRRQTQTPTPTPTPGPKYVQLGVTLTPVQLPNETVLIDGNFVQFAGELITNPAELSIARTNTQPDGVFVKDAVGSQVTLTLRNINNKTRFVGWELGGQQVSTSRTYVLTVPDQDPVNIVARFVPVPRRP